MLQPQELRIGNLVYSLETNDIQKIRGINEEYVSIDTVTFDYVSYDEIEPIPLTEEWLLKFGYIGNEPIFSEISTIFTNGIHKIWKPFNKFLDDTYRFEINYVHQLQNLYFALKGEELQFKQTT